MSAQSKDAFSATFAKIYALCLEDYALQKADVKDDTAVVTVNVKGVSMDVLSDVLPEDFSAEASSSIIEQMAAGNPGELEDYMANHTEEERTVRLLDRVMPQVAENTWKKPIGRSGLIRDGRSR